MNEPQTRDVIVITDSPEQRDINAKHNKRVNRYGNYLTAMREMSWGDKLALAKSTILHGAKPAALALTALAVVSAGYAAWVAFDANPGEVSTFKPLAAGALKAAAGFWAAVVPPALVDMLNDNKGPRPSELIAKHNEKFVSQSVIEQRPVEPGSLFERMRNMPRGTSTGAEVPPPPPAPGK